MTEQDLRVELKQEHAISSLPASVSIFIGGILHKTVVVSIQPEKGADSGQYPVAKLRVIGDDLPEAARTEFCDALGEFQSLFHEDHQRHVEHGNCLACRIRLSDLNHSVTYGMMLRHWQLLETRLHNCDSCGRGWPAAEYGGADLKGRLQCRHCNQTPTTVV